MSEICAPASGTPVTAAVQRALVTTSDPRAAQDLLFLERWEMSPLVSLAATLRVGQLRRANPALAAEIRAEISRGRPLTLEERERLVRA